MKQGKILKPETDFWLNYFIKPALKLTHNFCVVISIAFLVLNFSNSLLITGNHADIILSVKAIGSEKTKE